MSLSIEQQIESATAPQLSRTNTNRKTGFMFCQIEWHELTRKFRTSSIGWYGGKIEHRLKEEFEYFEESWATWDKQDNIPPYYMIFNEKWGVDYLVLDCLHIGYDHNSWHDPNAEEDYFIPTPELKIEERTQRASIGWYCYPCHKQEFKELTSELTVGYEKPTPVKWIDGVWKGTYGERPMLWTGKPNFGMRGKYYLPS